MPRSVIEATTNLRIVEVTDPAHKLTTAHPVYDKLRAGARDLETEEDFAALNAAPIPDQPEWYQRTPGVEPPEQVPQVGAIEKLGSDFYVCFQAQTDVGGVMVNYFSPNALNGGWRKVALDGGLDPWGPATYEFGALVTHNDEDWINRRDPNTQAFAPGVNGSGWMQISNRPAPWYDLGNEGYLAEYDGTLVRVTHNGRLWRNPTDGTFWEPGVAVWIDEGPVLSTT